MYENVFALNERPFLAAPKVERYFPAEAIEQARGNLVSVIERAAGPGLLIGANGTGKTLLLNVLAEQFRNDYKIAMLASARLSTPKALLQNLLFEIDLPYRDMEEGELRLTLIDHLEPSESCPNGMLLLVDEAHTLPLRLLEEIRMITNLVRDGQSRVRLVLAGGPLLEERFAHPKLASFNQRIASRCYLHTFTRNETFQYIRKQLALVGGVEEIFSEDALSAIHTATDGIPRLINQLCDHTMMLASLGNQTNIDANGIEEAWADLQQLPIPWQGESQEAENGMEGAIEFGQLSDMGADPIDTDSQFDQLERKLADIDEGNSKEGENEQPTDGSQAVAGGNDVAEETDFQPEVGKPEVELVFHGPHHPFSGQYEEEEIVIDRFASLDAETLSGRPRVTAHDNEKLVPVLEIESATVLPNLSIAGDAETTLPEIIIEEDETLPAMFNPASDPVMPELPQIEPRTDTNQRPIDDSDMIIVVDEETPVSAPAPAPQQVERRQYRQLFSQMRRG